MFSVAGESLVFLAVLSFFSYFTGWSISLKVGEKPREKKAFMSSVFVDDACRCSPLSAETNTIWRRLLFHVFDGPDGANDTSEKWLFPFLLYP